MFPVCDRCEMKIDNVPKVFMACVALYNFAFLEHERLPYGDVSDDVNQFNSTFVEPTDADAKGHRKGQELRSFLVNYMTR